MSDLRSKLIRLAHENPELRGDLLPLLKTADYYDVVESVQRILKKLRPGKNRQDTLKLIVAGVTKEPVLMDWFYNRSREHGGKLDSNTVRDAFGEALADWKDRWEIPESDREFDALSIDPRFRSMIQSEVDRYTPVGAKVQGINWSKVSGLYAGISVRIDFAKNSAEGLEDLRRWVASLQEALNP